jgi:hypothetical protein
VFVGKEIGEIVMADRSITNDPLLFGVAAACMLVLLLLIGLGGLGKNVTPNTPQSNTESPATTGSKTP